MGLETAGLAAYSAGQMANMYGQSQQNNAAQARYNQLLQYVNSQMQSGYSPEQAALMQMLGYSPTTVPGTPATRGAFVGMRGFHQGQQHGWEMTPGTPTSVSWQQTGTNQFAPTPLGQGFNAGQDALLQALRAPGLQQLAANGSPFNTSDLFRALAPMEQQQQDRQVASLRAGYGGSVGARYGTAAMGAEGRLRQSLANDQAARYEQINSGAYESAQQRMLAANQLLGSLAGSSANLGLAQSQNRMSQQQLLLAALGQSQGFANQRAGINAQLLSLLAGQQLPGNMGTTVGSGLTDTAQLMMLLNGLRSGGGGGYPTPMAMTPLPSGGMGIPYGYGY